MDEESADAFKIGKNAGKNTIIKIPAPNPVTDWITPAAIGAKRITAAVIDLPSKSHISYCIIILYSSVGGQGKRQRKVCSANSKILFLHRKIS